MLDIHTLGGLLGINMTPGATLFLQNKPPTNQSLQTSLKGAAEEFQDLCKRAQSLSNKGLLECLIIATLKKAPDNELMKRQSLRKAMINGRLQHFFQLPH